MGLHRLRSACRLSGSAALLPVLATVDRPGEVGGYFAWAVHLLHHPQPSPAHRSRRPAGGRTAAPPNRGGSRALAPGGRVVATFLLRSRERARRAGTLPRSDITIELTLATVRDLAKHLHDQRGKHDWALTDVGDIEAFLAMLSASRARRLTIVRQFFRFARTHKVVLVDPTGACRPSNPGGSSGRPSPSTSSVSCSGGGPPTRRSTHTRRCWASSRCCMALPAARSASCAPITSMTSTGRSSSGGGRTRCRWTRRAG